MATFCLRNESQFTVLHSFADGYPNASLVLGGDGGLYGTVGTDAGCSLFRITTNGAFSIVHSFAGCEEGVWSADLLAARDGSLYGTAVERGTDSIYKIATNGVVTVLHSFSRNEHPHGLLLCSDGNLFGTLPMIGPMPPTNGGGVVYRIAADGAFTILHSFIPRGEGINPRHLVRTGDGRLYGATEFGPMFKISSDDSFRTLKVFFGPSSLMVGHNEKVYGTSRSTIFEIATNDFVSVLQSFNGETEAVGPGDLIQASDGTLYGTSYSCARDNAGSLFKITSDGTLTLLHKFTGGEDGRNPTGLLPARDGSLYGVTASGIDRKSGTLFRLRGGKFILVCALGEGAGMPDIEGDDGNLYGTGDAANRRTIFKITPMGRLTIVHTLSKDEWLQGRLARGSDGNLYGVTAGHSSGRIFRIGTRR